jgi:hypothetical protein
VICHHSSRNLNACGSEAFFLVFSAAHPLGAPSKMANNCKRTELVTRELERTTCKGNLKVRGRCMHAHVQGMTRTRSPKRVLKVDRGQSEGRYDCRRHWWSISASASKTSRSPRSRGKGCIQRSRSTSITRIIFTASLPKNSLQISCGRISNPDIKDRRNAVAFNGLCVQLLSSEGPYNKMRCCLHPCFTDEPEIDT